MNHKFSRGYQNGCTLVLLVQTFVSPYNSDLPTYSQVIFDAERVMRSAGSSCCEHSLRCYNSGSWTVVGFLVGFLHLHSL